MPSVANCAPKVNHIFDATGRMLPAVVWANSDLELSKDTFSYLGFFQYIVGIFCRKVFGFLQMDSIMQYYSSLDVTLGYWS